ncbi:MAG: Lrp/AsnC ligand binding domain-containing protein [Pyrinomonadaceae bacterium]
MPKTAVFQKTFLTFETRPVKRSFADFCQTFPPCQVKDTDALGRLLRERIKAIPRIVNTNTTVVLKTFKETLALPIDTAAAVRVGRASRN